MKLALIAVGAWAFGCWFIYRVFVGAKIVEDGAHADEQCPSGDGK